MGCPTLTLETIARGERLQPPTVTARRTWLAVTITFGVFAIGLVAALLLLFGDVSKGPSTGRTTLKTCGSPVNGLFSSEDAALAIFGVPSRAPVTSCAQLLSRPNRGRSRIDPARRRPTSSGALVSPSTALPNPCRTARATDGYPSIRQRHDRLGVPA